MTRRPIRLFVAGTVLLTVLLAGASSPVAGQEICIGCEKDPGTEPPELVAPGVTLEGPPVDDTAAATRVRKAFLQAKKAFHEARQNVNAIKKGDKEPTEDVPSFFESEE